MFDLTPLECFLAGLALAGGCAGLAAYLGIRFLVRQMTDSPQGRMLLPNEWPPGLALQEILSRLSALEERMTDLERRHRGPR